MEVYNYQNITCTRQFGLSVYTPWTNYKCWRCRLEAAAIFSPSVIASRCSTVIKDLRMRSIPRLHFEIYSQLPVAEDGWLLMEEHCKSYSESFWDTITQVEGKLYRTETCIFLNVDICLNNLIVGYFTTCVPWKKGFCILILLFLKCFNGNVSNQAQLTILGSWCNLRFNQCHNSPCRLTPTPSS